MPRTKLPQPEAFTEVGGWLIDENNNRACIDFWGDRNAAETSLRSLKNCRNCDNCSDCSDCSGCSDCSDCSDCSRCSRCSGCSRCSRCSGCSRCSDCSDCSDCSGCSDCSDCSGLYLKVGLTATEPGAANTGPPPVPAIANIHSTMFAAVSRPGALDMGHWHKCLKTHCRAGWAVTLAGEEGAKLEAFYGTPLAAMMIYDASDPEFRINPSRFFDENDEALADMKRLASLEAAR